VSHSLLIVAGACVGCRLNQVHSLAPALETIFRSRVDLQTFVKSIYRFVILFHHLVACSFPSPSSNEEWINLERLFCIFQSLIWLHQFDKARTSVIVDCFILRVSFKAFFKFLHRAWEISCCEQGSTFLFVLLCNLRIDISLDIGFFFQLFASF